MKMFTTAPFRSKATALLFATVLGLASANAQSVNFTFAGGSNSPLSITWTTPITYTIGVAPNFSNNYPFFVIEDLGNLFGTFASITSTATFSRGSDGPFTPVTIGSNFTSGAGGNAITPTDTFFYNGGINVGANMAIGNVFTLTAGTLTTSANFAGAAPSNASYNTFLADTNGQNLGAGSAIPEPSTYAAIAGAVMLGFAGWTRRRQRKTTATLAVNATA